MGRFLKSSGFAIILGLALYVGIYIYGARSDAFVFSQAWVRRSEPLKAEVGEILDVRLSPWGGYRERFAGDDRRVRLVLSVTGATRTVNVKLALRKDQVGFPRFSGHLG
jgi:hypothetical protein